MKMRYSLMSTVLAVALLGSGGALAQPSPTCWNATAFGVPFKNGEQCFVAQTLVPGSGGPAVVPTAPVVEVPVIVPEVPVEPTDPLPPVDPEVPEEPVEPPVDPVDPPVDPVDPPVDPVDPPVDPVDPVDPPVDPVDPPVDPVDPPVDPVDPPVDPVDPPVDPVDPPGNGALTGSLEGTIYAGTPAGDITGFVLAEPLTLANGDVIPAGTYDGKVLPNGKFVVKARN